jgi:hypothetical protein
MNVVPSENKPPAGEFVMSLTSGLASVRAQVLRSARRHSARLRQVAAEDAGDGRRADGSHLDL